MDYTILMGTWSEYFFRISWNRMEYHHYSKDRPLRCMPWFNDPIPWTADSRDKELPMCKSSASLKHGFQGVSSDGMARSSYFGWKEKLEKKSSKQIWPWTIPLTYTMAIGPNEQPQMIDVELIGFNEISWGFL